jgi:hypothetical protein
MQIKARYVILALLLIIPSVINLFVPFYNRANPDLFGLPFFYWFQTLWLALCVVFYLVFSYIIGREKVI